MSADRTLVIVGASHAGLTLVDQLKTKLPAGWLVKVIEPNTHFHCQFGSVRAIVQPDFADKMIAGPLKSKFDKLPAFELIQDYVVSVDRQARSVATHGGQTISYTYLVVASGSTYDVWKTNETAHTDPIAAAKAQLQAYSAAIKDAEQVIIGGAGPVGLEVAGEIRDIYPEKKITLVDVGAALLTPEQGWHATMSGKMDAILRKANVSIIHNTKVVSPVVSQVETVDVQLSNGKTISGLYLAATGVAPRAAFLPAELLTDLKYVDTNPTFQTKADPAIFAVGDVSNNRRKVSIVIRDQLTVLVPNLLKLMAKPDTPVSALQSYAGDSNSIMGFVSFGRSAGVAQIGFIRLFSFLVGLIKGRGLFTEISTKLAA